MVCLAIFGCNMTDDEVRQKAGDIAVGTKKAVESASESLKNAYDEGVEMGKQVALSAQEKVGTAVDDAVLLGKIKAGFNLVKGLDARNITIKVDKGTVILAGTVPTELDKMKAEGVAYGVTGDLSKVKSELEVVPKE